VNENRVLMFDLEKKCLLTQKSNGNYAGQSIALHNPEPLSVSGGDDSTTSPVYVCLADPAEIDKNGILIDGSIISEIEPLTDVKITLVDGDAFAGAGFQVDVKNESDGTPISGLLLADFKFYATDNVTLQTINTAAEDANIPGRYNILAPGGNDFEDGTLTLRAPSLLTVSPYENPSRLALSVDIP